MSFREKIIKSLKKIHKYYRYKYYFPRLYKKYCREAVHADKVLFLEMRFEEVSHSFHFLRDRLKESGEYELSEAFVRFNFARGREYTERVKHALKEIASSRFVFVDDASIILSCIPLRQETTVINLWHACGAFKKFGRSTATKIFGDSADELDRYPNYENLDLVTVSSPEVVWAYEEAMHLPEGIVQPLGISRTDYFYDQDFVESRKAKLYEAMPQARNRKVILYAPTFRGRVSSATSPDEIDFLRMKELFGEEYVLVCKLHPFVKDHPVIPEEASDFAMDAEGTGLTIEDLLCCADICISDYSSLVFEYSLFEKPMIFYAFDYDEYCDWRGFYYDYSEFTPGPIVRTQDELFQAIRDCSDHFDPSLVIAFKKRFMDSCDGHATERIMSYMRKKQLNETI